MSTPTSTNISLTNSSQTCPKCHKRGTMKRSNFRTGSVNKPEVAVEVCSNCGYRIELDKSAD